MEIDGALMGPALPTAMAEALGRIDELKKKLRKVEDEERPIYREAVEKALNSLSLQGCIELLLWLYDHIRNDEHMRLAMTTSWSEALSWALTLVSSIVIPVAGAIFSKIVLGDLLNGLSIALGFYSGFEEQYIPTPYVRLGAPTHIEIFNGTKKLHESVYGLE